MAGFCGGFVSSILTIAAIGRQARANPALLRSASPVPPFIATAIELIIVIVITNPKATALSLARHSRHGRRSTVYGLVFALSVKGIHVPAEPDSGRAFELRFAFLFATAFAIMSLFAALLQTILGPSGAQVTVALGGLVDTHAATAAAVDWRPPVHSNLFPPLSRPCSRSR